MSTIITTILALAHASAAQVPPTDVSLSLPSAATSTTLRVTNDDAGTRLVVDFDFEPTTPGIDEINDLQDQLEQFGLSRCDAGVDRWVRVRPSSLPGSEVSYALNRRLSNDDRSAVGILAITSRCNGSESACRRHVSVQVSVPSDGNPIGKSTIEAICGQ